MKTPTTGGSGHEHRESRRALHRELRAAALKSLLSSRAKHPDEVRNKLKRLRDRDDERATFTNLSLNLNHVLTDLAGARVVVSHPAKEKTAFDLVGRKFAVANLPAAIEVKDRDYRASHALLEVDSTFERSSMRGTIVEVQVTSVANHVFNELEHDIRYKTHGVEPTPEVLACVDDLVTSGNSSPLGRRRFAPRTTLWPTLRRC